MSNREESSLSNTEYIPDPINNLPEDGTEENGSDPIKYKQEEPLPDNGELSVMKHENMFHYSITTQNKPVLIGNTQMLETEKWIGRDSIPELEKVLKDFLGDAESVKSFIKDRFLPNIELLEEKYDPDHPQINKKYQNKRVTYGNGIYFDLDKKENCLKEIMVSIKGEEIKEAVHPFINAYPEKGIFQQAPNDSTITYKIDWRLHSRYMIPTEGTGQDIFNILKKNGRVVSTKYGADRKLDFILDSLAKEGTFEKDYKIKIPGFHLVNDKIVSVDYESTLPDQEKVKLALKTLEEYGSYFKTSEFDLRDKLATIFKYSLINPFDYIKKGLGYPIEVVFSYGAPATSKTTITQLVRFAYQIPKEYFMQTGGAGSTEARLSGLMLEGTWPRLVDEAEAIFQKKELVTLNKQSIDGLYSRRLGNKDSPGLQHEQRAYSTLLYTSNYPPFHHTQDGSVRRYNLIYFDETCKFSDDDKEDFREKWLIDDRGHFQEGTALENLAPIGQFIAHDIARNPDLLKKNPFDLANDLIKRLYVYADLSEPPLWLLSRCRFETQEDYLEMENDKIINFIRKSISKAVRFKAPIIDVDGKREDPEQYRIDEVRPTGEQRLQLYDVANDTGLSWLRIQNLQHGEHYILEPGLLDELRKEDDIKLTMVELTNRFADLEYKTIWANKKQVKRPVAIRHKFEELIYPDYNESE